MVAVSLEYCFPIQWVVCWAGCCWGPGCSHVRIYKLQQIILKLIVPTRNTGFLPNLTLDWRTTAIRSTRGALRTFHWANLRESTTPCSIHSVLGNSPLISWAWVGWGKLCLKGTTYILLSRPNHHQGYKLMRGEFPETLCIEQGVVLSCRFAEWKVRSAPRVLRMAVGPGVICLKLCRKCFWEILVNLAENAPKPCRKCWENAHFFVILSTRRQNQGVRKYSIRDLLESAMVNNS